MIFGEVDVGKAKGCILGHSVRHSKGVFKKGRRLDQSDIETLAEDGIRTIIAARLEEDDVHEDEAARRLAEALAGDGVSLAAPFTGRANLLADEDGLVEIDRAAVEAVNGIDESITVATLSPLEPVGRRQMLATIKIIPFSVERPLVEKAEALLKATGPAVRLKPYRVQDVGLVMTRLPNTKDSVLAKSRSVIAERVEALGGHIVAEAVCDHSVDALREALKQESIAGCTLVLVSGASAIVDRNDIVPASVVAAGGTISRLGMPVDPGNLLLTGTLGDSSVVGVPSCARSPKLNGFDWVLQRLMAGLEVTAADISAMGVGGLLKEIASRPQPREQARPGGRGRRLAKVGVAVLAAGRSTRMGAQNKLLMDVARKPMVRHVVEAALASKAEQVLVVTGHEADGVRAALEGLDVSFTHNPDFADGMSTSMRAALDAIDRDVEAALFCLGDMPAVSTSHLDRLIAAFDEEEGREICVPVTGGKRGNPVLWGRRFFQEMKDVRGDVGARHLIGVHEENVCEVAFDDEGVLEDIDTPEKMEQVQRRHLAAAGDGGG